MKSDKRPLMVSIHCITYNHEPYIRQCLEGFVMQKTNFRFEAVVHDDASTDGTAAIIKEYAERYPNIIKPILETENQWSKHDGSLNRILNAACTGKYVATCEGDDYWSNPNKLQMQFNALEQNPDCSICFHRVQVVSSNNEPLPLKIPIVEWNERKINMEDHIHEQFHHDFCFSTCSFFMRREVMNEYVRMCEGIYKIFPFGDIPIIWTALLKSNGYYIPEIFGCYRRFSGGYTSHVLSDINYALTQNNRVIKAYRAFDEFTDYKYHKEFEYSITKHELNIFALEKTPSKMMKKKYFSFFRDRGIKYTMLYLWSFSPFHFNLVEKYNKFRAFLVLRN